MFESDPTDFVIDARMPSGLGGRWYGVFPASVSDVKDPDGMGRVKVTLPWSADTGSDRYEVWARVATLMGGNNRGSWFIPDPNDEVLVGFEGGIRGVLMSLAVCGMVAITRRRRWTERARTTKRSSAHATA